jgi:malate dehydrogenase
MELQDSAYSVLQNVTITTDPDVAFEGAQVAVLLGGFPRKAGMERKDLIEKNVQIMKAHGSALERCADRNCKIVVVANPANTNCLVAMKYAPSIPRENFTALTRLDHDRMRGMLAVRLSAALNRHVSF